MLSRLFECKQDAKEIFYKVKISTSLSSNIFTYGRTEERKYMKAMRTLHLSSCFLYISLSIPNIVYLLLIFFFLLLN